jgi:site-specific DNA-adenine methylase
LVYSDNSKELLHTYNEVKDSAQALLGFIASKRDCTLKEVYQEFGLELNQD